MKLKLTADSVAAAAVTGKQYYITDTDLSRFALRVSATGKSKVFTYRADLPKTEAHPKRRLKDIDLGRAEEISVREARKRASEIRGRLQQGWDPEAPMQSTTTNRRTADEGEMCFDVGSMICIKEKADTKYGLSPHFERPEVYKTYPTYLRHLIASAKRFSFYGKFHDVPMRDITHRDAGSFHRHVAGRHGKIQANRQVIHLRMIFNWAIREGHADINPFSRIAFYSENVKKDPIPHEELSKFVNRLSRHHNYMAKKAVLLGIMSGLRQHNIVDLEWEDNYENNFVDFSNKEFHLRHHKNANQTKKAMIIPFSNDVEALLKSLPRKAGNNYVFHSRGRSSISQKTYCKAFEFAKEAIDPRFNIEKLTPNATRHTFATTLLNQAEGINKEDLADLLGHTSTAMVRRAYAKDDTAYRNKLRNKIPTFIEVKEDDLA